MLHLLGTRDDIVDPLASFIVEQLRLVGSKQSAKVDNATQRRMHVVRSDSGKLLQFMVRSFQLGNGISQWDLRSCELVVLSACQTGLGRARGGEGMLGLRRAFQQAGAKTVVSSLWNVRDASTRELMLGFYRRLWQDRQGKLEALRGAQLEMLARNRERRGAPLPATWGAFVLSGEWR